MTNVDRMRSTFAFTATRHIRGADLSRCAPAKPFLIHCELIVHTHRLLSSRARRNIQFPPASDHSFERAVRSNNVAWEVLGRLKLFDMCVFFSLHHQTLTGERQMFHVDWLIYSIKTKKKKSTLISLFEAPHGMGNWARELWEVKKNECTTRNNTKKNCRQESSKMLSWSRCERIENSFFLSSISSWRKKSFKDQLHEIFRQAKMFDFDHSEAACCSSFELFSRHSWLSLASARSDRPRAIYCAGWQRPTWKRAMRSSTRCVLCCLLLCNIEKCHWQESMRLR